ncbi:MAG: CHAT domain-containing protein [Ignavibacteriales bacterium]
MTIPKRQLSLYLLDDRLVVHITGEHGGAVFGKYNLRDTYDEIKKRMHNLEQEIDRHNACSDTFKDSVRCIGSYVFEQIIRKDQDNGVDKLYAQYISPFLQEEESPLDISISFTMDTGFLGLPVELMRDQDPTPLAARIPVYKRIVSPNLYRRKKELFEEKEKIKALLISSSTHLRQSDKVLIGNDERNLNIYLPEVKELSAPDSEVNELKRIIDEARDKKGLDIEADVLDPSQLDYESFVHEIAQNKYDIIHYNGHGYYEEGKQGENTNSSIFLRKNRDSEDKIVAIRRDQLRRILGGRSRLKFVYLSCCQGAKLDQDFRMVSNNFVGLLDAIAFAGVPNVLGMRWPISPADAKSLAKNFYKALFLDDDHNTIEAALVKARAETLDYNDQSVWCSPVLVKQDL